MKNHGKKIKKININNSENELQLTSGKELTFLIIILQFVQSSRFKTGILICQKAPSTTLFPNSANTTVS